MCRWLAYAGIPIAMDTLLFQPTNSLIRQSLSAQRSVAPTNGDGFGLGWYGDLARPGLYRDTMPAWSDANLRSLAEQIRSPLFFAHVRASTGTATSRLNCHPFRYGDWLFMHNGQVGGWPLVRQDVEGMIRKDLYRHREGSTDSEAFFYLALGNGLMEDPASAFALTVAQIVGKMRREGVAEPFRMTAACTDGKRLYAVRWSCDGRSPSLYWTQGHVDGCRDGRVCLEEGDDSVMVLSEPLDEDASHWNEVAEGSFLVAEGGRVTVQSFNPLG
ncbi:class II glutamine amidotransferase [Niveispirillum sp. KHB5.9]|uniref:class II glutamine amidotransferase n=1 Tax=Niveispirillum sp. KHB5.9 TaxID=3400269 RepID=UPI003A8C24DE